MLCCRGFSGSLCKFHKSVCGFRVHSRTRNPWKNFVNREFHAKKKRAPNVELAPKVEHVEGRVRSGAILKAIGFTAMVGGCSLVGTTVWQYEKMRSHAINVWERRMGVIKEKVWGTEKRGEFRQQLHIWWESLSEGQRIFFPICLINVVVFLGWKVPALRETMLNYFASSTLSRAVCSPLLLSGFSHYSALHLGVNMYVLHSFCTGAVNLLGPEQFVGVYLTGAAVSGLTSFMYRAALGSTSLSLGASGAILAVIGVVCAKSPDSQLAIVFLPMFTFSAGAALKAIMAFDSLGMLLRWKILDHAGHLGGTLFGFAYAMWGESKTWQKREGIIRWWHRIREGTPAEK